jgi:hypothetical protein
MNASATAKEGHYHLENRHNGGPKSGIQDDSSELATRAERRSDKNGVLLTSRELSSDPYTVALVVISFSCCRACDRGAVLASAVGISGPMARPSTTQLHPKRFEPHDVQKKCPRYTDCEPSLSPLPKLANWRNYYH